MEDMMLDGLDLYLVVRREVRHQVEEMCGEYRHEESMSVRVCYVGTYYPARRVASELADREGLEHDSDEHYYSDDEDSDVSVEVEVVQAVCGAELSAEVARHEVSYVVE